MAGEPDSKEFREAVGLYDRGMYERARTLFESISASTSDPLAAGYSVLCAVKMGSAGYLTEVGEYENTYPYSVLMPQIHYQTGLNLFDANDFAGASRAFASVTSSELYGNQVDEFLFKQAYSEFGLGYYDKALEGFSKVESLPYSDYTAPARYSIGYIHYYKKDFEEAYGWFSKSVKDPRFTDVSNYYMLECRFMNKDYKYVTDNGTKLYNQVPEDRKPHLARMISESYLVLGDADSAKEYYEKNLKGKENMNRSDYFYAGSVLYAVEDYEGAIGNFSKMTDRSDSLGQLANYHMGYSYIQTKNKVAAMSAFKDASQYSFDPDIQDDAYFNYAKLAFDLNHDTSVFNDYLSKFSKEKNDQIYGYMALASLYDHDYAGAVAAYDNIDELDEEMKGNYMKANYLRANQLISNGAFKDAIPCLKAASFYSSRQDPFNQLAKYWLAESYFRSEKYGDAEKAFVDLYNISALDGQSEGNLIPYDIAYCHFKEGDYAGAVKWFDKYLGESSPEYAKDASLRKADCHFISKDYAGAIDAYGKAIERYGIKDDMYPYYRLGIAYGLQGNPSKKMATLAAVKDAASSVPFYSETLYELGRSYVSAGDNADAVSCFKTLKGATRDSVYVAKALIELGMIARNESDYDQALSYYKKVAESRSATGFKDDALLAIESIYQAKQEPDKYLDYAEKMGLDSNKTDDEKEAMYFNSAEQIFLAENYQKALSALQNYLNKYPKGSNASHAYFYIAECYKNLGNKENACNYYAKVVNGGGTGSYAELAMLNFANLSYSMEHYSDAYDGYNSLLENAMMDNNRFTAELGMMRAAYKGHFYEKALACADKVKADKRSSEDQAREADYVKAKSYLATSRREEAFAILEQLSRNPATDEGAEASFLIIQDTYDKGRFDDVETKVYKFSDNSGDQAYWLAKSFIVLGDSFVERDNYAQAKATFESILKGYVPSRNHPDDITDNVKMKLSKLQKLMNAK
jgi:tetratricopeptide (TPR) repeat protein